MTTAQRNKLMIEWWPAACRAQGWKVSDRARRLRVLSVAVSFPAGHFGNVLECLAVVANEAVALDRPLASASELNSREDVDRVKALLLMLADNLDAAREMDAPEEGAARRVRWVIIEERLRCLALYPVEQPMGRAGAEAIVAELIKDMFNRGRRHEVMTVEDLTDGPQFYRRRGSAALHEGPSQVRRLVMRLDGLLHTNKPAAQGFRVKAGHSLHDMKTAAGVRCDCRKCCLDRQPVVPALVGAAEAGVPIENCPF